MPTRATDNSSACRAKHARGVRMVRENLFSEKSKDVSNQQRSLRNKMESILDALFSLYLCCCYWRLLFLSVCNEYIPCHIRRRLLRAANEGFKRKNNQVKWSICWKCLSTTTHSYIRISVIFMSTSVPCSLPAAVMVKVITFFLSRDNKVVVLKTNRESTWQVWRAAFVQYLVQFSTYYVF